MTNNNNVRTIDEVETRPVYGPLQAGSYRVKLKASTPSHDRTYRRFEWEITEGSQAGRIVIDNKFPQGLTIFYSQLRQLWDIADGASAQTYLDRLSTAESITMYVSFNEGTDNTGKLRKYTNYNFLPPVAEAQASAPSNGRVIVDIPM